MPAAESTRISLLLRGRWANDRNVSLTSIPLDFTSSHAPPLFTLIDNVYFFPLSWRRFIIEFCRIQKRVSSNEHLRTSFSEMEETSTSVIAIPGRRDQYIINYDRDTLSLFLDLLVGSPTSILDVSERPSVEYEPVLIRYSVLRDCPFWYDLFCSYHERTLDGQEILENLSALSSILS
jgi:hypothetical protein